jgi:succinate-semialdehyde dehydrogenase/glutarate-semialdehyde dehydrogenase
LIGGQWVDGAGEGSVFDKYNGRLVSTIAEAGREQVAAAVAGAKAAFEDGPPSLHDRAAALSRAADILRERHDPMIETIVSESGFTHADAEGEFARAIQTLLASADEARRLTGDMIPIGGAPGQENRMGFTIRVPLGVVCAITPFNSPLNTVAHKIAPAFAAGNAVVLKPASATPLTAMMLVEILIEAGVPTRFLSILHGPGGRIGAWLCEEPDVKFFAFTGSTEVGAKIQAAAGLRRTQMELGSIAATILNHDADLDAALPKVVRAGYRKAGQVCTSIQLLYVHGSVFDLVQERLVEAVEGLKAGDPHEPDTFVGPMIDEQEAIRAEAWVREAVDGGATALVGGTRTAALMMPTLLTDVTREMRVMSEEIFAPVVCLRPFSEIGEAIEEINATPYGLATGIFTNDLEAGFAAARRLEVGGVHINETSSSRVDVMPYGGCKASGFGREGPRYAIREMTDERMITISLSS